MKYYSFLKIVLSRGEKYNQTFSPLPFFSHATSNFVPVLGAQLTTCTRFTLLSFGGMGLRLLFFVLFHLSYYPSVVIRREAKVFVNYGSGIVFDIRD